MYSMRMARVNVYLPDDLAAAAREAGLNVSGLTQAAVRAALASALTDAWLERVARLRPIEVDRAVITAAVAAAKDEMEFGHARGLDR